MRGRLGDRRLRLTLLDAALLREEGLPGHANNPSSQARLATRRNLAVAQVDGQRGQTNARTRAWLLTRREVLDDLAGGRVSAQDLQVTPAAWGWPDTVGWRWAPTSCPRSRSRAGSIRPR